MKILILEGIATSGKSSVISLLKERLPGRNIQVASEDQTHEPIMDQKNKLHLEFYQKLINKMVATDADLVIFDRLYLTQAFRAGVSLEKYSHIEQMLTDHESLTVFLKVDEKAIGSRIAKTAERRDAKKENDFNWGDYFQQRGEAYYIAQQQNQIQLLKSSKVPYLIRDTTSHNYEDIVGQIIEHLKIS